MGSITIRIPQNIQIEYTLNHENITHRILEMLNTLLLRSTLKSENRQPEDAKNKWLGLFSDQPELIDQITEQIIEGRKTDVLRATSALNAYNEL